MKTFKIAQTRGEGIVTSTIEADSFYLTEGATDTVVFEVHKPEFKRETAAIFTNIWSVMAEGNEGEQE